MRTPIPRLECSRPVGVPQFGINRLGKITPLFINRSAVLAYDLERETGPADEIDEPAGIEMEVVQPELALLPAPGSDVDTEVFAIQRIKNDLVFCPIGPGLQPKLLMGQRCSLEPLGKPKARILNLPGASKPSVLTYTLKWVANGFTLTD